MWKHPKIAISGIHTDAGKTVASAVIAEALRADYWKPVQAGSLDHTDSMKVKEWISNTDSKILQEHATFTWAGSPHEAAKRDGHTFSMNDLQIPVTERKLIIETAGGLHSPLDQHHTMVDFLEHFHLPTVLVSRNYLGSINHTLLSAELLLKRNIDLTGIIICGERLESSESFIKAYLPQIPMYYIPEFEEISKTSIRQAAEGLLVQLESTT